MDEEQSKQMSYIHSDTFSRYTNWFIGDYYTYLPFIELCVCG